MIRGKYGSFSDYYINARLIYATTLLADPHTDLQNYGPIDVDRRGQKRILIDIGGTGPHNLPLALQSLTDWYYYYNIKTTRALNTYLIPGSWTIGQPLQSLLDLLNSMIITHKYDTPVKSTHITLYMKDTIFALNGQSNADSEALIRALRDPHTAAGLLRDAHGNQLLDPQTSSLSIVANYYSSQFSDRVPKGEFRGDFTITYGLQNQVELYMAKYPTQNVLLYTQDSLIHEPRQINMLLSDIYTQYLDCGTSLNKKDYMTSHILAMLTDVLATQIVF